MTVVLSHGGLPPIRHNLSSVVIHRHLTLRHPTRRHPTRHHPTRHHPTHTAVSAPAGTGSAFAHASGRAARSPLTAVAAPSDAGWGARLGVDGRDYVLL